MFMVMETINRQKVVLIFPSWQGGRRGLLSFGFWLFFDVLVFLALALAFGCWLLAVGCWALLRLCFIYMAGTVCRGDGRRGKPEMMMGGDDWDDDWGDWDGSTFWSERRSPCCDHYY